MKHQLIDDFDLDMLAIKIDTTKGPVIISTTNLPSRRQFYPIAELK